MLKPFSKLFQAALIISFVAVFGLSAIAQQPPASTAKKSGASASCDGALDIVPSKPMTFARKRRPAKNDGKQQVAPADTKTEQRPPAKKNG